MGSRCGGSFSSSLAPEDVPDDAHQGADLRHHLLLHEIEAHGDQRHACNTPRVFNRSPLIRGNSRGFRGFARAHPRPATVGFKLRVNRRRKFNGGNISAELLSPYAESPRAYSARRSREKDFCPLGRIPNPPSLPPPSPPHRRRAETGRERFNALAVPRARGNGNRVAGLKAFGLIPFKKRLSSLSRRKSRAGNRIPFPRTDGQRAGRGGGNKARRKGEKRE